MSKNLYKILNRNYQTKKGFIALVSIVVITGILLVLVIYNSNKQIVFNDILTKKIYRAMNYYYAENCIEQAKLKIRIDYFININRTLSIPELNCSIVSINRINDVFMIITKGDYMNATVYARQILNSI